MEMKCKYHTSQNLVMHSESGFVHTKKVVGIVKNDRFRETELKSADAFENYSVMTVV